MTTTRSPRITNRQISTFVRDQAEFQANSASAEWTAYPSLGRLPGEWIADLHRDLERVRSIDGRLYVVYSYSTPIAWYVPGEGWVEPPVKYSPTTSKQQHLVRMGYEWRDARNEVRA